MSGLHPHFRNEEDRVSSTSRRGANYICYAATTPPPTEVSRPAFGMEGLVQTPGMLAVLARIQA
eukprot:1261802-Pyramimonas_sp.AAC.1